LSALLTTLKYCVANRLKNADKSAFNPLVAVLGKPVNEFSKPIQEAVDVPQDLFRFDIVPNFACRSFANSFFAA
jgi:hypothetical protein